MRPDIRDPWLAARVSTFMRARAVGRWKLEHFEVDEDFATREAFRAMHDSGDNEERRQMALARIVPPGRYIALKRKAIAEELKGEEGARLKLSTPEGEDPYVPVMSDTPAEIRGHRHAIENATGRVLVGGLGLGVLVSALLARPDVTHIDVVEVDYDVLNLTGPYYKDPRVTTWHADIHEFDPAERLGPDARWDYVWHDIWTHISDRNLHDDEAEHGISYPMMFDKFEPFAAMQGAWAFEEASAMRANRLRMREENREWEAKFFAADFDDKVQMVFEQQVREHVIGPDGRQALPKDEPIPEEFLTFFEEKMGLKAHLAEAIREALDSGRLHPDAFEEWRNAPVPLGKPNEEAA